jgi:hypothetical protein
MDSYIKLKNMLEEKFLFSHDYFEENELVRYLIRWKVDYERIAPATESFDKWFKNEKSDLLKREDINHLNTEKLKLEDIISIKCIDI